MHSVNKVKSSDWILLISLNERIKLVDCGAIKAVSPVDVRGCCL